MVNQRQAANLLNEPGSVFAPQRDIGNEHLEMAALDHVECARARVQMTTFAPAASNKVFVSTCSDQESVVGGLVHWWRHPALALVPIIPFMPQPAGSWRL